MNNWYIYTNADQEFIEKLITREHIRSVGGHFHIANLSRETCLIAVELLQFNGYGGKYGTPDTPPNYFEPFRG